MIYTAMFVVGIILIVVSTNFFLRRHDLFGDLADKYDIQILTRDLAIALPGGNSLTVNVAKSDRLAAWRIYSQIKTRVAAIDFNEKYDSVLLVHESLYKVFDVIRTEISEIPIDRVKKNRADAMVDFYLGILNEGIRPHLTQWHIPLKQWVENEQKKHPDQSILELEQRYPRRKELLESLAAMNNRMKSYSNELLRIAKGGEN